MRTLTCPSTSRLTRTRDASRLHTWSRISCGAAWGSFQKGHSARVRICASIFLSMSVILIRYLPVYYVRYLEVTAYPPMVPLSTKTHLNIGDDLISRFLRPND